ncbi:MAG: BlaI family penicillinase repressor [Verrucomicrobiales bacterium]|jgi:BlaI family penicillinase repressor
MGKGSKRCNLKDRQDQLRGRRRLFEEFETRFFQFFICNLTETLKNQLIMTQRRNDLSRREREILDIIFTLKRATCSQIREHMSSAPTGNAVRSSLQILENKGEIVRNGKEGREFIYEATSDRETEGTDALEHVVETFFDGSMVSALAAHFSRPTNLPESDVQRLRDLIDRNAKTNESNQNKEE